MRIPEEVILDIKYKNPIEDVISPYVALKRSGSKNLKGLCPFHSERTPSFTVYPESNSYYCFGCGAGGDAVTFIKNIENLDYIEALKFLANRAGVTIPENRYDDSIIKLKQRLYEVNKETAKFYYENLFKPSGKWVLDYFKSRGLKTETITHFGLGAALGEWDSLIKHLKSLGFKIDEMLQAGVIAKSSKGTYYDRFRNRSMFPIMDLQKHVIGFSGRCKPGEEKNGGKYVNTNDTLIYKKSHNLFGMNFAKGNCKDGIVLVEGNMDVISLHQAGITNAVAALGTSFTEEQARLIARYTDLITLVMDSDEAGIKATNRAIGILSALGIKTKVVNVPSGKDPDEFIKLNGGDAFKKLIENASGDTDYMLFKLSKDYNLEIAAEKISFLNKAAEYLSGLNDSLAIDYYAGMLSDKYGIQKSTLLLKINEYKGKNKNKAKKEAIRNIINPKINRAYVNPYKNRNNRICNSEELILNILMKHPEVIDYNGLDENVFISEIAKRIYLSIKKLYSKNTMFDIALIESEYTNEEIGYITGIFVNNSNNVQNFKELIKDAVDALKEESLNLNDKDINNMDNSDWERYMQNIIDKKVNKDG